MTQESPFQGKSGEDEACLGRQGLVVDAFTRAGCETDEAGRRLAETWRPSFSVVPAAGADPGVAVPVDVESMWA